MIIQSWKHLVCLLQRIISRVFIQGKTLYSNQRMLFIPPEARDSTATPLYIGLDNNHNLHLHVYLVAKTEQIQIKFTQCVELKLDTIIYRKYEMHEVKAAHSMDLNKIKNIFLNILIHYQIIISFYDVRYYKSLNFEACKPMQDYIRLRISSYVPFIIS